MYVFTQNFLGKNMMKEAHTFFDSESAEEKEWRPRAIMKTR